MSYQLGQGAYTRQQADHILGWTPAKLRSYWNRRAQLCKTFADEGECLAQVARHEPVTITPGLGGLGDTATDISRAISITAGLFTNPDATLRVHGPPIVAAADKHVIDPFVGKLGEAIAPYVLKYVVPVFVGLYIISGVGAYYSFQNYKRVRSNPSRRSRRRVRQAPRRRSRRARLRRTSRPSV